MAISIPRVTSITVAFNPNPERLAAQVSALLGQVERIIIVDNGSSPSVKEILSGLGAARPELNGPRIQVIALGSNKGVASGFNIGAREARSHGMEYMLLLDHDSVPGSDMVRLLVAAHRQCVALPGAHRVAAVGPRVNDLRDPREYPFVRLGWLYNRRVRCSDAEQGVVACDFLISSGSLIALDMFAAVGEFDELLFIDSVDLEWCCRARARQFTLYGVWPLKWKLKDVLRWPAKLVAIIVLVQPRLEYAQMAAWAIRDAVARRGGEFRGDQA